MSRRLAIPIAVTLVVLGARASRGAVQCPIHGVQSVVESNITGSATLDRGLGPSTAVGAPFGFALGSSEGNRFSPIGRGDAVDLSFALMEEKSDRPTMGIQCHRASFIAIASGEALPLKALCGAVPADVGAPAENSINPDASLRVHAFVGAYNREVWLIFDLSGVEGTASGASTLNSDGDGTVTFTLDVPTTTLTTTAIVDAIDGRELLGEPAATIDFGVSNLQGVAAFGVRNDPCPPEGGGCDCAGYYHGWLPGGG